MHEAQQIFEDDSFTVSDQRGRLVSLQKSLQEKLKLLFKLNEDILNSHMTEDIEVEIGRGRDCEFLIHRNYKAV